ncbi:MAG: DUF488 domain-containing protein [Candidatus Dormibacteria bacterium]
MTAASNIIICRVYSRPLPDVKAPRILLDRIWPRGIRKEELELHLWLRELAPSDALRKWFGHQVERWPEFDRRYREELKRPEQAALLGQIRQLAREAPVLLLYGAHDEEHNQAVVVRNVLLGRPPEQP